MFKKLNVIQHFSFASDEFRGYLRIEFTDL